MKKNFKRNKILLTSLIGLAVVASASVAFSTWIFGLNKDNASIDDIEVTVDGYKDTTKYIDIAVGTDKTIHLAEYNTIGSSADKIASTAVDNVATEYKAADFDISLSKFEFAYSTSQFTFNSISFKLVAFKTDVNSNDNEVVNEQIHGEASTDNKTVKMRDAKTDGKKYEYLSLATATIEEKDLGTWFKPVENIGSFTYYEVLEAKKTLSLKWGDYFGTEQNTSPAVFYNNKYETYKSKTVRDKLEFLNTANSEMEAMTNIFKDTDIKIKITATLNVTDITTGKK